MIALFIFRREKWLNCTVTSLTFLGELERGLNSERRYLKLNRTGLGNIHPNFLLGAEVSLTGMCIGLFTL